MANIRKFRLLIVDDFDDAIDKIELDNVDMPRNLGFELEFTTLESRLTTYFTSAREKRTPITLNINFLNKDGKSAYQRANEFKAKVQANMNKKMVLEYDDTTEVKKYWEGKIQRFQQDELDQFKTLICPISFLPATPKYYKVENQINVEMAEKGKSYPYTYPYSYGYQIIYDNIIDNTYFDEIPLKITITGKMSSPAIALYDVETKETYSTIRFDNFNLPENDELIIDATQSKVLLKKNGKIYSAYDYISKAEGLDSFLFAKANTRTEIIVNLDPNENGSIKASYHQYTL